MPADDLILNVRQIAGYDQSGPSPSDAVIIQRGGLGGPYFHLSAHDLVSEALQEGGPFGVVPVPGDAGPGGIMASWAGVQQLAFNAYGDDFNWMYYGGGAAGVVSFSADGYSFGMAPGGSPGQFFAPTPLMTLAPTGDLALAGSVQVSRDPASDLEVATARWTEEVVGAASSVLQNLYDTATVHSFNARTGPVILNSEDILAASGALIWSPNFEGSPRAPTPPLWSHSTRIANTAFVHLLTVEYLNNFIKDQPFVYTFNGRSGDIIFTAADLASVEGAPLNDANLTGTPTAPTAPAGDSSTQISNTEFVNNAIAANNDDLSSIYAPLDSPEFFGYATAPTAPPGSSNAQIATTAFVMEAVAASVAGVASFNGRAGAVTLSLDDVTGAGGAPLDSPAFTGTPTAPTAGAGTSTAQLATTAFVMNELGGANIGVMSFNGRGGAVTLTSADIALAGGLANPSAVLTGAPSAPTPSAGDNSSAIATTAFVTAAINDMSIGVATFNGRTGAVTLSANDISAAGGLANPSPALTGTPTAPTAAAGNSSTQLANTAFVGNNFLALAGGTMAGPLALAADPVNPLQAATKEYVDTEISTLQTALSGGYLNVLRNGAMDIWQRGANTTVAPGTLAFVSDGWMASCSGATMLTSRGVGYGLSKYALVLQGASGLTGVFLAQRIESIVCYRLAGKVCTFQARIYNVTPNPITPTVTFSYPNAVDVWTSATIDQTVTLQTIAAGAQATVACSFLVSANAVNGYAVQLNFGAFLNFASAPNTIGVTNCDLRLDPGATIGLNNDPPPPEVRNAVMELLYCQRYYVAGPIAIPFASYAGVPASWATTVWNAPTVMRGTPTVVSSFSGGVNTSGGGASMADTRTVVVSMNAAAAGNFSATVTITSLSAEL